MKTVEKLIKNGSIITQLQFLENYNDLDRKKETYHYDALHQPAGAYYGNRFQGHPVWETNELDIVDKPMNESIKSQIQKLFDKKIKDWQCRIRLTLTTEMQQSVQFKNNSIGFIHHDKRDFAGVIPFEQSYVGGTAFFENEWDKVPDVTYGSWPNRLVLYNGQRNHAACHDYTFEKRYSVILFFNLIENSEHIKI
tara:strand:- start:504 stop:1088 length:585 start_codon:yes stop_codon:yes gene_type:complete